MPTLARASKDNRQSWASAALKKSIHAMIKFSDKLQVLNNVFRIPQVLT
jgi:hypothetical protein